jgi:hypothetical protein
MPARGGAWRFVLARPVWTARPIITTDDVAARHQDAAAADPRLRAVLVGCRTHATAGARCRCGLRFYLDGSVVRCSYRLQTGSRGRPAGARKNARTRRRGSIGRVRRHGAWCACRRCSGPSWRTRDRARPGRPGETPGFLKRGALTRPTLSLRKFYKDFCQSARFQSCARLRCEKMEVRLTVADSVLSLPDQCYCARHLFLLKQIMAWFPSAGVLILAASMPA